MTRTFVVRISPPGTEAGSPLELATRTTSKKEAVFIRDSYRAMGLNAFIWVEHYLNALFIED